MTLLLLRFLFKRVICVSTDTFGDDTEKEKQCCYYWL